MRKLNSEGMVTESGNVMMVIIFRQIGVLYFLPSVFLVILGFTYPFDTHNFVLYFRQLGTIVSIISSLEFNALTLSCSSLGRTIRPGGYRSADKLNSSSPPICTVSFT
jgi:hypothetical protein